MTAFRQQIAKEPRIRAVNDEEALCSENVIINHYEALRRDPDPLPYYENSGQIKNGKVIIPAPAIVYRREAEAAYE